MASTRQTLILVAGAARSGTSLVSGAIVALGANPGPCFPGNQWNPRGYFENLLVKDVIRRYLHEAGADPNGVAPLPNTASLPPAPGLRDRVLKRLGGEGPHLVKDAKLLLMWPLWVEAFPEAIWVLVDREPRQVAASCMRTPFMIGLETEPEWLEVVERYRSEMRSLSICADTVSTAWFYGEDDRLVDPRRLAEEILQAVQEGMAPATR